MINRWNDLQPPQQSHLMQPGEPRGNQEGCFPPPAEAVHVPSPRTSEAVLQTGVLRLPRSLTPHGQLAFWNEINRYANALSGELDRESLDIRSQGAVPEHTAADVARVSSACVARLQAENADRIERIQHDRSVLATILLTASLAGLSIMSRYLNSTWQQGLFVALIVVGIAGLVLTWAGRRVQR